MFDLINRKYSKTVILLKIITILNNSFLFLSFWPQITEWKLFFFFKSWWKIKNPCYLSTMLIKNYLQWNMKKEKQWKKRRRVFQYIKLQRDTWQRPRPAGSTPHWCSSLHWALLHRSTAQWWDTPQSRPPWSPPATGIQESNAKLDQKQ